MPRRRWLISLLILAIVAPAAAPAADVRFRDRERPRVYRDAREPFAYRRFADARADRLADWRDRLEERRERARQRFERGRLGERFLRREILVFDPSELAVARAQSLAMSVSRETVLDGLGVRLLVLRPPEGMTSLQALRALREADPEGVYELNHVFSPSDGRSAPESAPAGVGEIADPAPGVRIGMIDAGIDRAHPAFAEARIVARTFPAGAAPAASPHGTAVASLLVGHANGFSGALPKATLYAADVFGDRDDGGSAEAIAEAIAWLAGSGVSAINVSLAGPPNAVLEAVCRRAAARGVAIVAAVGNDGPAAPVAFPAAYPAVVAVTAVDAKARIYVAANRGPEVAFAAAGVGVRAAVDGGRYASVSGTSFATPHVAAILAKLPEPDRTVKRLAGEARDLGPPGRDPIYGFGVL